MKTKLDEIPSFRAYNITVITIFPSLNTGLKLSTLEKNGIITFSFQLGF